MLRLKKRYNLLKIRQSVLSEIQSDYLSQAKATQEAEDNLRGISTKLQKDLRDLEAQKGYLTKVQYDIS